jgi:hypothetical protein
MKLSLGRQYWRALIDVHQAVRVFALAIVLSTTPGCRGGCPKPQVTNQQRSIWEHQLAQRQLVPLEPQASISIKRDVHTLRIAAEAGAFAQAFHHVMTDPERRFGMIRVERMQTNLGRPFQVGERFQGRYDLQDAIKEQVPGKWRRLFGELVQHKFVQQWLCEIENEHTSDYGIIDTFEFHPPTGQPYILKYSYLEGSPIAGSSTFIVTPIDTQTCQLTQIFEYQEQSISFATFFATGGLKLHNQVVYSQTMQAAQHIGARVLDTDIPAAYQ